MDRGACATLSTELRATPDLALEECGWPEQAVAEGTEIVDGGWTFDIMASLPAPLAQVTTEGVPLNRMVRRMNIGKTTRLPGWRDDLLAYFVPPGRG